MNREIQYREDFSPALVAAFASTYIPRWDTYTIQNEDGSYRRVGRKNRETGELIPYPLTLKHIHSHLKGRLTLSAYMLAADNTTAKMCLDADDPVEFGGLITLASHLHLENVPTYLELSRRGGHLWFFFEQAISGNEVRRFGKQLQQEFQLETVELYPKQSELKTGPGSGVRLPFGVHRVDYHVYHFIKPSGEPLAPTLHEQIEILAQPQRIPQVFVWEVLSRAPETPPTPHFEKNKLASGDTLSERIRNAISVYDFVSQYIQLDRGGKGLCPFHDDHRESLSVNTKENYWHCFACEIGGSVIHFYMRWYGVSYEEAVTELAKVLL